MEGSVRSVPTAHMHIMGKNGRVLSTDQDNSYVEARHRVDQNNGPVNCQLSCVVELRQPLDDTVGS